ncbi:unnamed protein product [Cuscuta campestris]|uniref:Uncharacterized protein n=1 Tax=Cuscuta campestris TaxID=132261 RepID=A0A484MSS0_9ASTE|nr:unnamed protein product [Cuscuta campestris]
MTDLTTTTHSEDVQTSVDLMELCCLSCRFQILPAELSSLNLFHSFLPDPIVARANDARSLNHSWLREQIEDCLLSDTEEEA